MKGPGVIKAAGLAGAVFALMLGFGTGCRSGKKQEAPKVEPKVEEVKVEPDRVDSIDLSAWVLQPGETTQITVRGTADRQAKAVLTGVEGSAVGTSRAVPLSGSAGKYQGSFTADTQVPAGKYRVEAEITGGKLGPAKLVSSRGLSVLEPPKKVDACQEAVLGLLAPQVYFAYDRSVLDEASLAFLRRAANKLGPLSGRITRFVIEGHCDERGTIEYNLALGQRRAGAVRDFLSSQPGMAGLKIETITYGKERPVYPDAKNEEEHAKNRRAVFVLECSPEP